MNQEHGPSEQDRNFSATETKETPLRMRAAVEAQRLLALGKVEVKGREHIAETKGKKVIIVPTHNTDQDVPLTIRTLDKDFNIRTANESLQNDFSVDPKAYLLNRLAGIDNFAAISYEKKKGKKVGRFDPSDYERIRDDAEADGKTILVAAHRASRSGEMLKGGIGAVYLQQITPEAVILPVTVNVKYEGDKTLTKLRPDADVSIGQPVTLAKIAGIERLPGLIEKKRNGESMGKDDQDELLRLNSELHKLSDELMRILAQELPDEKRGIYQS